MKTRFGGWLLASLLLSGTWCVAESPSARQALFVFMPQTEDQTAGALKILDRYPALRIVWAVSPRWLRSAKSAELKTKLTALIKEGRIAPALQIPNAPLLPLLLNSDDARGALPADATLLTPPYASSDDVVQHVSRARADFIKNWGTPPMGIVLPYGALSPALAQWFQNQNFSWIVAALGMPGPAHGPYQLDGLLNWKKVLFWDGAQPQNPAAGLSVTVWDERDQKGGGAVKTLESWGKMLAQTHSTAILPDDANLPDAEKIAAATIQKRTWTTMDWSPWIGIPEKNALWSALSKTRQAMESYQNSGQAQIPRLEAATEEYLTAQNSSFFIAAGSATLSDIEREDRARDFEATLDSVYRLIGQTPPDDLVTVNEAASATASGEQAVTTVSEELPDGRDHLHLSDALLTLDVVASSMTVTWTVGLSSDVPNVAYDVYADINGLSNVGSTVLLPGRNLPVRPEDAWEYALNFSGTQATLYVTQAGNTYMSAGTFPTTGPARGLAVTLPREQMRGNSRHWGYRVLALDKDQHIIHVIEKKYH